ncbi:uroporphyrinogen-III synthase [Phyllobacterium leguminum]|uniref:Uroporphyrinogen-III synthase n=1 Tax=Phyllobacterium leguminum TaxID=314237 RepID=A0A318T6G0_9HYPH|nr:uroporphyrinogen-III synthase [Phyllobacterium leguminum]PYE88922.1 uroporphyrinogen-III synthase [Phyllobacterium leguminum]
MARVLVTRPEPGASLTARRLEAMGFSPVVLPLSETTPLAAKVSPGEYDAVTITSVNAIRHGAPELIASLIDLPIYAVGEKTARAAKAAGFRDVIAAAGDGEALAALLLEALSPGAHVLYLAGRVRRSDFEKMVRTHGLAVTVCETYDTVAIDRQDAVKMLGDAPIDAALVYSVFAAKALITLSERPETPVDFWQNTRFLCLSSRIQKSLSNEWKKRASVSERPDEQALFKLLAAL